MTRKNLANQLDNNLQIYHVITVFVVLKTLSEKKLQEESFWI